MVQILNFLRNFQKTLDILKVLWYHIRRNAVYTAVGTGCIRRKPLQSKPNADEF